MYYNHIHMSSKNVRVIIYGIKIASSNSTQVTNYGITK